MPKNLTSILLAVACYIGVSAFFFPDIVSIADEAEFLAQSQIFAEGALSAEDAGLTGLPGMIEADGKHYGWKNPGLPVIQAVLLNIGGQDLCHMYSLLVHVLLVLVSVAVLRRLNVSPCWSLLILAHPTLVIYSRTMLADESAALAIMTALWLIVSGPRVFVAGLAVGAACLFRMQCMLLVPFFLLAILVHTDNLRVNRRSFNLTATFAAGTLPGIVLLLGYYFSVFNHLIGKPGAYAFALSYLGTNLKFFALALTIWWPLMILTPVLAKTDKEKLLRFIYLPFLGMLLFYFWIDRRPNPLVTSVIGQRLLVPVIPVMVIAYGLTIERLVAERGFARLLNAARLKWMRLSVLTAACIVVISVSAYHGNYLNRMKMARLEVERLIPEDAVVLASTSFKDLFQQRIGSSRTRELRHWYYGDTDQLADLDADGRPLFVAAYSKGKDTTQDKEIFERYRKVLSLEQVPTSDAFLTVFRASHHPGTR